MRLRTQARLRHRGSPLPAVPVADDWDPMFDALKARLRQLAGGAAVPAAMLPTALRECAQALDCLHDHLAQETGRRRRLELDAFDARIARARSQWPRPAELTFDRLRADDTPAPEPQP
jgi:hypothetical protein